MSFSLRNKSLSSHSREGGNPVIPAIGMVVESRLRGSDEMAAGSDEVVAGHSIGMLSNCCFLILWLLLFVCNAVPSMAFPFHDKSEVRCLDCHVSLPFEGVFLSFHQDISTICSRCHDTYPCNAKFTGGMSGHPVDIKPTMVIPEDMVLDSAGRIGCITCHVFHERKRAREDMNSFYLRRPPGMRFCYACHKKL